MDPICRTVRFVRVVGSPHGHEPLAAGYAITIIAIVMDMCVPRTRITVAIVEAGRNVHVALARPSKMQLPCRIEAEVSRLPATVHGVCTYGPTPLPFHGTE